MLGCLWKCVCVGGLWPRSWPRDTGLKLYLIQIRNHIVLLGCFILLINAFHECGYKNCFVIHLYFRYKDNFPMLNKLSTHFLRWEVLSKNVTRGNGCCCRRRAFMIGIYLLFYLSSLSSLIKMHSVHWNKVNYLYF